jgi:glycosyltransferase involved in cell wall biosynthesis
MHSFRPYTIHHLQLHLVLHFKPSKENQYIIIWFEKIPLGHIWLHADESLQQNDFLFYISKAIYAAVEYYMHFTTGDKWKNFIEENDFNNLSVVLKQAVHQFQVKLNQNKTEKISVIICTRNRPQALQQCLQSLTKINDENIEIIVVDNASDNNETKIVAQKFRNIKYVFEEIKGLDIARNTGAINASYNIIAYTDDDVQIPVDWITNIRTCFASPLTMAVTGMVIPSELNTIAQFIFEKEWSFNKGYLPIVFNHAYFLKHKEEGVPVWNVGAGANMAFRREAFNIAGLFDERLDVGAAGCSGDSEMWYRILAEGWNCNYYPHLYVYHQHRKTIKELRKQLFSYMKGHVCAMRIQYEKYGHRGNLKYVQKTLTAYYFYRAKKEIAKTFRQNFSSFFTEIKGCIAGWKYYSKHKNSEIKKGLQFPVSLNNKVVVNKHTLVSVIIPCYNQANYLQQAINSVLTQTHTNVEVIVIDDGSEDNTNTVCAQYGNNVHYIRVERVGLSAARNIGIQFSKGDFIVFLDADDFLYPGAIEINLYFFSINKTAAFISGTYDKIDAEGNYINAIIAQSKYDHHYLLLLQGNYIAMEATVMYRRDLFFYFHFDTSLQSCEDYDLNLKISRVMPVFHHEKKIAVYRMHTSNMSKNRQLMLNNALAVLKRQERFLRNDEEKIALQQGLNNWSLYYNTVT